MKNLSYFTLFNVFLIFVNGQLESQDNGNSTEATKEPMLPISSPPVPPVILSNAHTNDVLHCPMMNDAISSCDQSNIFYYYECCGKLNMYCCLKFREWFWMSAAILGSVAIIAFITIIIRCLCCRARASSYDF
ncbi:unnamed protein product, partial [Mesorhabditis belari]|uniref:Uncharacterized protein n=1 Tax=Mesorhabditis belari TaxID=2138241 RepID=A0AAF3F077_9BILA